MFFLDSVNPKTRKIAAENPKPAKKVTVAPAIITAAELDKVTEVATGETVPNLLNMSTREVLRRVSGQELKVKFVGQGLVSDVQPAPGSQLPENKEITVILK